MKLRHAAVASLAFTAACAPMQKQGDASAQAVQDTVRVSNQHPFDMAVCQPAQPLALLQPVNPDILVGAISLARPQVMECLVPPTSRGEAKNTRVVVKATVTPEEGKYDVQLAQGQTAPAEVSFDPVTMPEGTALATCLQQKMMALPVKAPPDAMRFSRRFIHFNSKATEPSTDPLPEQRFLQLGFVRQQRSAASTMAFGARDSAAETYDAAVLKYQKSKDRKLLPELSAKCNQVVEADAKWASAVEAQLQADQLSLTIAQELTAKDAAAWSAATANVQEALNSTQEELNRAQSRHKADQEACSKMNG
jgi:hypothetical protein